MKKPEDYKLIATLWFRVIENKERTDNYINIITEPETTALYNIRSLYTSPCNPLGFAPLGNNFNISFNGARILVNNPNSAITKASVNDSFTVNVPNGSFNASSVYYDSGNDFINVNEQEVFMVNGGYGLFEDAKIAVIKYDNTGEIFGYPFSRRVEVYKLKKKHLSEDEEDEDEEDEDDADKDDEDKDDDKISCKVECSTEEESNNKEDDKISCKVECSPEEESNNEEE